MKAKYIIIEGGHSILFPEEIRHDTFKDIGKIEAAGFVSVCCGKIITYGDSLSLGISSRPGDAEIIEKGIEV